MIIQVEDKDMTKVFAILVRSGRFARFGDNMFRIEEHEQEAMEKIQNEGIKVKVVKAHEIV